MKLLARVLVSLAFGSLPVIVLAGCRSTSACPTGEPGYPQALRAKLELPVTEPPYSEVRSNWKERLDQPYAYLEMRGSYTHTARALKDVLEAVRKAGIEPTGAPFALFFDDPGTTPVDDLLSRACVPIADTGAIDAPFRIDVLPSATVAYAFVGGPYGDVPRAYPGLFGYLAHMGWKECGPIREIYLVPPGSVATWSELVCEVQVPVQPAR